MKNHWLALSVLCVVAAAWGVTFTMVKNVLGAIPPETFIMWRFLIAAVPLLIVAVARRKLSRLSLAPGIILGLLVFVGYWAQTRGLMQISPSRSALLTGLYVVMVPFCEWALRRRRVGWRGWVASLLAVIGTGLLIGGFDMHPSPGDLLTIFCAFIFALHVVLSAEYTRSHPAIALAAIQIAVVGLAAIPFSAVAPPARATSTVIAVIIFTAFVTTSAAFFLLMWGQARVSATEAAVMLSFEPVAAAMASVAWGHEPVTAHLVVGGAVILSAMLISQVAPKNIEWP